MSSQGVLSNVQEAECQVLTSARLDEREARRAQGEAHAGGWALCSTPRWAVCSTPRWDVFDPALGLCSTPRDGPVFDPA
jgi:hypothetical protein